MAWRTVDSKMLSLYLDWFYMCMHYMCIALARAPTWQSGRSASVQAGRIGSIVVWHGPWVRAVRWRGLYNGAAYLSTSESYLRDLGVVRLIPRAAYSPEITVIFPT